MIYLITLLILSFFLWDNIIQLHETLILIALWPITLYVSTKYFDDSCSKDEEESRISTKNANYDDKENISELHDCEPASILKIK